MKQTENWQDNENLDPADWASARERMHRMVDDAIDYLSTLRDRPVWQPMPETILPHFHQPLPRGPEDPQHIDEELKAYILPYTMGNVHPRFWAWYMGAGTVSGVIGDFWASVLNPNLGGGQQSSNLVEAQVIDWLKEIMHYPMEASGILVSGGSMANLVGLAVARHHMSGFDIRLEGMTGTNPMVVYASQEVHSSVQKAIELMGMGSRFLHKVPVLADYTMDVSALEAMIKRDRAAGLHPIAVIGTAGTINTGAIDDLDGLANLCKSENLWFHVDGAIGSIAMLSPLVQPQLKGIERADSVTIDLHKWLHMPFEVACTLVRNATNHRETFSLIPDYLARNTRGLAAGHLWFSEYGIQLSRRFRALKVWMSLKEHGADAFGRMISKNIHQAHYLGRRIDEHPHLELVAPIGLDIVCFRYNPGNRSLTELNNVNKEIKLQLEEQGIAAPGYTTLGEMYCLRIAIANHRSQLADFDALISAIEELGHKVVASQ
ncbi:MAG: pyridoxal-dependent decarboxylase [Saprospiraceae bacterium]